MGGSLPVWCLFGMVGSLPVWYERKSACLVWAEVCLFGLGGSLPVWYERESACLVWAEVCLFGLGGSLPVWSGRHGNGLCGVWVALRQAVMTNPFWDYSLRIYSSLEVREACLYLQSQYRVDVNVMLYVVWQAARGRALNIDQLQSLDRSVQAWRESAVLPLRALRVQLRGQLDTEPVRDKIKSAELEAEHYQQDRMFELGPEGSGGAEPDACLRDNIALLSGFYCLDATALETLWEALRTRFKT